MNHEVAFVPELRRDVLALDVGHERVVWSPIRSEPAVLDPVAAVVQDVVDGHATVEELASDVCDAVGVSIENALAQINRVLHLFDVAGLLTASRSEVFPEADLFASPPST